MKRVGFAVLLFCCLPYVAIADQACMSNKIITAVSNASAYSPFKFVGAAQIFGRSPHKLLTAVLQNTTECYSHDIKTEALLMFGYFGKTVKIPPSSHCITTIRKGQTLVITGTLTSKKPNTIPVCVLEE